MAVTVLQKCSDALDNVENCIGVFVINKARRMNNELFQIEDEMSNLVGEMNQPLDEKDPTQLTENVLNNYY